MKFYEALGLEPNLALDPDDLKKRFYERSRQWHPDRFGRASAPERQQSLDTTALLNDAFRTLKDPVTRAEYFLESNGIPPSKNPPPELLEEVFELNMALEELREGDSSARPNLKRRASVFQACCAESGQDLDGSVREIRRSARMRRTCCRKSGSVLDRRRYVSNLYGTLKRN